jgi:malonyl-CoA O-methyltransferase
LPGIDRRAARRRFDRAASTYSGAARLETEVAARMLERLDYVKIQPRRILDAGSGPPGRALAKRYPQAQVIALDFSVAMLRAGKRAFLGKNPSLLGGDLGALPLAADAIDFTWCNMALHWLADPLPALRELARVIAPGGLLMFSTLGPDTLKELRATAGGARVHSFTDMHDIGDMLVAAGFTAPVMDMEIIQIEYGAGQSLLADLRASGQTSALADRPRGLSGRRLGAAQRAWNVPRASFEVVYGHAWKGRPRASEPEPKTVRVFKRMA